MGFSDEDRILMENVYVIKGYGAKNNLLTNFRIKLGDCGNWTNVWKSCMKLARWQDEAAAFKAYKTSLVFLICNIRT